MDSAPAKVAIKGSLYFSEYSFDKRLLAERIVRHHIGRASSDLLTIVAGIQPRMMVAGLADIVVAADFRLGQKYGIGDHGGIGEMVAVTDDELRDGGLVALRRTVAAQPALLQVSRIDDQRISHEMACRKSGEAMGRPSGRVRAAIHPDDSVSFGGLGPHVDRDQLLSVRIPLLPGSKIPHGAHLVGHDVARRTDDSGGSSARDRTTTPTAGPRHLTRNRRNRRSRGRFHAPGHPRAMPESNIR